ncbi:MULTISPECIES: LacI family DNA-binding transcriptional regulator [Brachybacterium]|uniref:LacI family transcriptional regulator n=1 Tax=Brachybacterium alimentarium TaxID=47845 RepID=A0A2A3YF97_9MICO|nr:MULTISPECIES: LacI family DNA-binding transcriptional regulator [Brachybacterium]PCC37775.1 LacI family transcriptional regulator [Brachybacterium alimentarium]RCS60310.1 LacI family transcriptional regulator [Brachybacterium sp. JB7]RCS66802.1 LacI family transcriptional regulator [Brachybacterium alimentarium]RCS77747.1 LacI family transcriptional regulator [Brachybacterium alimentarium]RCS78695.1 LacI family transcriptional regulator [Brachybacterium alimentarium]
MPAVRLSDVAQDAGVSLATASRVLNGSARVPGKAVAEKVEASAARLGYVPNAQAQALARSRSGLIGLVVHDIADPYFATIAREVQQQVFASQSQVLLTQTDREIDTEVRALRSLIAQQVDALVLVGSHRYGNDSDAAISTLLEGFARNGGKVVGMGQSVGVGRTIVPDNAAAAHELATALIVEGHRRFAVVQGIAGIPSAGSRTGGFVAALTEAGIEPELSIEAGLTRDGGYELAEQIEEHLETAAADDAPLCVFAPADVMALGTLGELRRRGISVPGQVAVAGFGGVPDGADSHPTLTTIALPLHDMARQAVEWVLEHPVQDEQGGGDEQDGQHENAADDAITEVHVRGDVLLRESTAVAAKA